jgi:nitroimidazol reductase NimA-like FMN-containing flavoprotein (pyridoxamine 5'-phosphate oxidase superfamily)
MSLTHIPTIGVEEFLTENSQLILSTLNEDSTIHSVPVSYRYREGEFIIWTFLDRHKVLNLNTSPNVTLLINQEDSPKYAMIYGTAKIINRDDETFKEKMFWVLEKHVSNEDASRYLNDFILSEMDFISVKPDEILTYDEGEE